MTIVTSYLLYIMFQYFSKSKVSLLFVFVGEGTNGQHVFDALPIDRAASLDQLLYRNGSLFCVPLKAQKVMG